MTAEGHFIFSISCIIFAKNMKFSSILEKGEWFHIIPSSALTCLLPDIDHPNSFLGKRIRWISRPIFKIFGHRGFTHSFVALFLLKKFFDYLLNNFLVFSNDISQGMILGYLSHIIADMLTPAGIPFLWPFSLKFRFPILSSQKKENRLEYLLSVFFLIFSILVRKISFNKIFLNYLVFKI